jgi:hypothetical protein
VPSTCAAEFRRWASQAWVGVRRPRTQPRAPPPRRQQRTTPWWASQTTARRMVQAWSCRSLERRLHWQPGPWPRLLGWQLPALLRRIRSTGRYCLYSLAHGENCCGRSAWYRHCWPEHLVQLRRGWSFASTPRRVAHRARHSSHSPHSSGVDRPCRSGEGLRVSLCVLYRYQCAWSGRFPRESPRCRGRDP